MSTLFFGCHAELLVDIVDVFSRAAALVVGSAELSVIDEPQEGVNDFT